MRSLLRLHPRRTGVLATLERLADDPVLLCGCRRDDAGPPADDDG